MTITMNTTVRNVGTEAVRSGHLTVPLMATPQTPQQVILSEVFTPEPLGISHDKLGNRSGVWDLAGLAAGATLVIGQQYQLRVWGAGGGGINGAVLPQHTASEAKIEAAAPDIHGLAVTLTAGLSDEVDKLARFMLAVREALAYDTDSPAANQGALAGLAAGGGTCEEFASLFVALCRAAGIPARVVNGWGRDAASAASAWGISADLRGYRHAWAEVYVAGVGWATVDPTFNRAGISGVSGKGLPAGILIAANYGDRSIVGSYAGGRLEVTRQHGLTSTN